MLSIKLSKQQKICRTFCPIASRLSGKIMEKMILSPLQLSSAAKSYYEGSIPKNTYGMEKYVATDGENTMFVKSDYQPAPGEVVFYIKRMRSELYCQLYRES